MSNFIFTFICLIPLLTSISSHAEEINITSNPSGVEIFIKDTQNKQKIKLGKTPHKMSMEALINKYAKGNVFIVELNKEGFDPYKILISRTGKNNIDLFVNMEVKKNIKDIKLIDAYTQELFEIQRLIRVKNYSNAIDKLSDLEKKFPHYSMIYELMGSALYLNKEFSKSLSYYRKAFSKNSDNIDAYRMKTYLEKKFSLKNQQAGNN